MAYANDPRDPIERRANRNEQIEPGGGGGGWWAWWWLWIIALFVIIWYAGWGWGGYGGWFGWGGRRTVVVVPARQNGTVAALNGAAGNNPRNGMQQNGNQAAAAGTANGEQSAAGQQNGALNAANTNAAKPIAATVPAIVNHNDQSAYLGKNVNLQSVKVQRTANNGALWVGPNKNASVLVVQQTAGNSNAASKIEAGQTVDIHGTVEPVTGTPQLEKEWNVKPADAQQAQKDGVYIAAETVTPLQQ